jgi:hypothetical protein
MDSKQEGQSALKKVARLMRENGLNVRLNFFWEGWGVLLGSRLALFLRPHRGAVF